MYPERFTESLKAVEAARENNIKLEPRRMTAQEKEDLLKAYHPDYKEEQFMAMYGMLTGTASTGIMLLRELDPEFKTPVNENLVYQNLPAIAFGFPLMLLANLAPTDPLLTLGILFAFFVVMNVILFRSFIFKRRKPKNKENQ